MENVPRLKFRIRKESNLFGEKFGGFKMDKESKIDDYLLEPSGTYG